MTLPTAPGLFQIELNRALELLKSPMHRVRFTAVEIFVERDHIRSAGKTQVLLDPGLTGLPEG